MLRLYVSAYFYDTVHIEPAPRVIFKMPPSYPSVRKLTITNMVDKPIKIKDIETSNPLVTAEYEVLEKGRKFEVAVSLLKPITTGKTEIIDIKIYTDRKAEPVIKLSALVYTPKPTGKTNSRGRLRDKLR